MSKRIITVVSLNVLWAFVLLSACQPATTTQTVAEPQIVTSEPQAAAPTSTIEAEASLPQPSPTPGEETLPAATSTPETGLIINEDPFRAWSFNVNTLAYELPGMEDVDVVNITYGEHQGQPLTLDVFYPPGSSEDAQLPVVVFGLGYRMSEQPLRNAHFYTSWGRLVAAAGMAAITYDTELPDQDLETLMGFILDNAEELRIDPTRIGFFSSSANGATVMSYLMQEGREEIQFSVYYYTLSLTPDRKFTEQFEANCANRGCLVAELADVSYVDPDLPLFIAKMGKEIKPHLNEGLDHFIEYVQGEGADVTLIEYADGRHGFDTEQETEESAAIIAQTVEFMKTHFGLTTPPLALTNGLVIPATGEDPIPDGTIVIEDGLIRAIGAEGEVEIPEGAEVIDVEGRTIMPGLIDARASDLLNRMEMEDGQLSAQSRELFLRNPLRNGVTTLRATGWDWERQQEVDKIQAALAALGNTVPEVLVVGTSLAHGEGSAATNYYPDQTVGVVAIEETRQAVKNLIDLGVDQVSFVMSVTQEANQGFTDGLPTLSLEQLEAIVEVAHSQGKRVIGQAVFPDEAELALLAGVDELAAWPSSSEPMPDELIQALVEQSVPVVSGFSAVAPQSGDLRRFLDAGGTLVYGTYAPNSGSSPEKETRIMYLHDMTLAEILQAATVNAAEVLEMGNVIGTLEVGKQADVIVLDGNPLEDVRAYRNVAYVINNGELVLKPDM